MTVEQSATFLAASILICLGSLAIIGAVIIINNLFAKFWKPVRIFTADSWHINPPQRFATQEELDRHMPELNNPHVDPVSGEPMREVVTKEKTK